MIRHSCLRFKALFRFRLLVLDLALLQEISILGDTTVDLFDDESFSALEVKVTLMVHSLLKQEVLQKHDGLFLHVPLYRVS